MTILDNEKKRDMDDLLDRLFEELESRFWHKFPRYVIKVSQLNDSFFVLAEKPRGKILNDDKTLSSNYQKIFLKSMLRIVLNFHIIFSHVLNL